MSLALVKGRNVTSFLQDSRGFRIDTALTDAEVQSATEDVVSAAIDVLRRDELRKTHQHQDQYLYQQQQGSQREMQSIRGFQRSRHYTVDNVPKPTVKINDGDGFGCGIFGASDNSSFRCKMNSSMCGTTTRLDSMTDLFLERSRARLQSRLADIARPIARPITQLLNDSSLKNNLFPSCG